MRSQFLNRSNAVYSLGVTDKGSFFININACSQRHKAVFQELDCRVYD